MDPLVTFTLRGLQNGETAITAGVFVCGSCPRVDGDTVAGPRSAILCTGGTLAAANYTFAAGTTASFTINAALLNVNAVAASKKYGAMDPSPTFTLSGFQNGKPAITSGVTGSASCTTAPRAPVAGSPS